jgi:hypothetical protein
MRPREFWRRSLDLLLTFAAFGLVLYTTILMRDTTGSATSAATARAPIVSAAR